jgi:hypothetical protein
LRISKFVFVLFIEIHQLKENKNVSIRFL